MSTSQFWIKLDKLTETIRSRISATKLLDKIKSQDTAKATVHSVCLRSSEEVLRLIEECVIEFLQNLKDGILPKFVLNKRGSSSNTVYNTDHGMEMLEDVTKHDISLTNEASEKKYCVMMACLSIIYKLVQSNKHSTKRDLFYADVNLFEHQRVVDETISDISCMLGVPRHCLHILSSSKGFVYGNLRFQDHDGNILNCNENGIQVPNHVEGLTSISSTARYILVVEKEATYQRLVEAKLNEKLGPCIVLTAKGFPDINTRMLLRKLWEKLEVPVFALVDADPYGIEIMFTYKFGSRALAYEARRLTCPSLTWLGILPKDVSFINISEDVLIPFSKADEKRAKDLLRRPYVNQNLEYKKEIELLISSGRKAEIECLDSISHSFMVDIYLPQKIKNGDWI